MKRIAACALACAGLAAFGASACETPSVITVPDGKAATMDQMVDAQKKVKEYMANMDDYLACIDGELKTAGDDAPDEFKSLMTQRHNDAVSEMEAIAGAFNEQVRAFKAAHPQPQGQQ
ncbi:MAG TPA: hypothetical protein VFV10_03080 [Gammaproteobacteria bacterium]|nr:hypothetical protein [Gammaproteobacteria bacterium]